VEQGEGLQPGRLGGLIISGLGWGSSFHKGKTNMDSVQKLPEATVFFEVHCKRVEF